MTHKAVTSILITVYVAAACITSTVNTHTHTLLLSLYAMEVKKKYLHSFWFCNMRF